jgi:hypothetical protein
MGSIKPVDFLARVRAMAMEANFILQVLLFSSVARSEEQGARSSKEQGARNSEDQGAGGRREDPGARIKSKDYIVKREEFGST